MSKITFRKTKVGDLDMTIIGDQNILRLDVSVDNIEFFMEILEGKDSLGGIETNNMLIKLSFLLDPVGQISTGTIVCDQIGLRFTLERKSKIDNIRMLEFLQYSLLIFSIVIKVHLKELLRKDWRKFFLTRSFFFIAFRA